MFKYPPYFLQTQEWAEFWLQSSNFEQNKKHSFYTVSSSNHSIKKQEKIFIYEYPWQLKQKFWYIPKLYLPDNSSDYKNDFQEILNKIDELADFHKPTFIKVDFDYQWLNKLEIFDNLANLDFVQKALKKTKKPYKAELSIKNIQFLSTMTLDLDLIESKNTKSFSNQYDLESLKQFWQFSEEFWKNTNQKTRRYSKKSLSKEWLIDTQKTTENFETFWRIYKETSKRQKFAIHSRIYTKMLFDQDFTRIIILRDFDNLPQCVWFGQISDQTLTYLYGGNSEESFEKYGQYLCHIVAIKIGVDNHLKFYDLGGYNPSLGFGKFKEGYKGEIRNFLGPIDIILKPLKFNFTNGLIKIAKFGRN